MSFKRLSQIFFMWLGNILPLQGHQRQIFVKLGGVNIKGPCLIYKDVSFDSVAPELITIGKGVRLTRGCIILTHYLMPDLEGVHFRLGEVKIEDDVFVGANTVICNSVTIGKGAVIGAGSIVTKNIPAYQVWAGNPARYIKDRAH